MEYPDAYTCIQNQFVFAESNNVSFQMRLKAITYIQYLDEEDLIKPKNFGFDSRIWQDETESDLIKVIEGE